MTLLRKGGAIGDTRLDNVVMIRAGVYNSDVFKSHTKPMFTVIVPHFCISQVKSNLFWDISTFWNSMGATQIMLAGRKIPVWDPWKRVFFCKMSKASESFFFNTFEVFKFGTPFVNNNAVALKQVSNSFLVQLTKFHVWKLGETKGKKWSKWFQFS